MKVRARIIGEKYEVERHLATGGMGELYIAKHMLTTQRVALKVLDRRLARSGPSIDRFLREVRLAAKIGHPAIVQVYDAGLHTGEDGEAVPFLAMELLQGRNLAEHIALGGVSQAEALQHIATLLEPLAAAHACNVVHRDLKPENVFLERAPDGALRVRLLDFGIAREADNDRKATSAGQALGTVYYMAPEQALDARAALPPSDVWSLGVMLYQALAGEFPFDGDTAPAVLMRACRDPHRPLAERCPELDPRLCALVDRCLSKDPLDRPETAAFLRDELAPILADPTVQRNLAAREVAIWTYQPAAPDPDHDPYANLPAESSRPRPIASGTEPLLEMRSEERLSAAPFARTTPATPQIQIQIPTPAPSSVTPHAPARRPWGLLALALPLVLGGLWFALRPRTTARPRASATANVTAPTTPSAPAVATPGVEAAPPAIAPTIVVLQPTPPPTVVRLTEPARAPQRPRANVAATAAPTEPSPLLPEPPSTPPIVTARPSPPPLQAPVAVPVQAPVIARPTQPAPTPAPAHQPAPTQPDFVTF